MGNSNHSTKVITAVTYVYMTLPFLIFAIGWMKIYFWIPAVAAVIFCAWKAWRDTPAFWRPQFNKDNIVKIIFILAIIAAWVFYSGIGKQVFQNSDHYYRNGIFEVLVDCNWPVYNKEINFGVYPEGTTMTSMMYYIGFWMPAAVVGKLFGLEAGYTFQMIWAFIGIVLIYYYICTRKKKLAVWPLALLIFFSGLGIIGMFLTGPNVFDVANDAHIEWWVFPYQYSANTTQLFWVFNQSLPAWLCTVFAMQQTNNRSLVFILATLLLNATFPFVGLLVFVVFWALSRKYTLPETDIRKDKAKSWLKAFSKDTFTIQNILGGGVLGIFTYLYIKGNVAASNIASQESLLETIEWEKYLILVLVEVGAYLLLLYKYNNNKGVYFVTLLSLVMVPLLMGGSKDFCMRVSIPALFILMLLVQDTLEASKHKKDKFVFIGLAAALCIGSITPIHEISRTIKGTMECNSNGTEYGTTQTKYDVLNFENFSGSVDDNLFFDYIAKEPKEN